MPGGVQGLDRYAYVNNSPVNYIDPSGHKACKEVDVEGNCLIDEEKTNADYLSCMDTDYCNLNNDHGGLDYGHFEAGVNDSAAVEKAWHMCQDGLGLSFNLTHDYKGHPFTLSFNLAGIETIDELRGKFIPWYAIKYQKGFAAPSNVWGITRPRIFL